MEHAAAMIYCPNPLCQTANPETHRFCQQCRHPLPRRYLWAVDDQLETCKPGTLLGNRYLFKHSRILLDTRPGLLPGTPADISPVIEPYLRLSPYQPHLPGAYGILARKDPSAPELLLLEQAPIWIGRSDSQSNAAENKPLDPNPAGHDVTLMPALTSVWHEAKPLRQLNWLWQIAKLWHPFSMEGVAPSLLSPPLLRVEGSLVRLLQLNVGSSAGGEPVPDLGQLGQLWLQWTDRAHPAIQQFLQKLCQQLVQGQIETAEQLMAQLDRGLDICARSQSRQVRIANYTDKGPNRQRNEDACYPPNGSDINHPAGIDTLTIVCDGIGGHEGGSVASNLAIETIQKQLQQKLRSRTAPLTPATLIAELKRATLIANDLISQRNDSEQREGRKRMGTTLVMALACDRDLYLTHIGDSRAYLIVPTGCYQLTLDDDVAAREARLGYAFYRDALQRPASGSLVQALGMNSSKTLHPTVQRLLLDEDIVLLLCSDGLSDNDRVEQCWETEILPLLSNNRDLAQISQQLIEIANTRNGHDNVTVSLIHCQVTDTNTTLPDLSPSVLDSLPAQSSPPPPTTAATPAQSPTHVSAAPPTQISPAKTPGNRSLLLVLSTLILLGLGGLLAYFFMPKIAPLIGLNVPVRSPAPTASSPTSSPSVHPTASADLIQTLKPGTVIQIQPSEDLSNEAKPLVLLQQPEQPQDTTPAGIAGTLAEGSTLQMLGSRQGADRETWLQFKVCSTPNRDRGSLATPSPAASSPASSSPTVALSPTSAAQKPSPKPSPQASGTPVTASPSPPSSSSLLQPGEIGWIQASKIATAKPSSVSGTLPQGECDLSKDETKQ